MNNITQHIESDELSLRIGTLIEAARNRMYVAVNTIMVNTYFEIGRIIVEDEQNGQHRADYGKQMLKKVAKQLTAKYGRGFSVENLQNMRKFYLTYSNYDAVSNRTLECSKSNLVDSVYQIEVKASDKNITANKQTHLEKRIPFFTLSWSHYLKLMRIENPEERKFYELEATNNHWSLRELERQYDSSLYERLALSRNKDEIVKLSQKGQIIEKPQDLIKDPYILEFTGFPELSRYSEKKLETRLIDNLQMFLLELGKGFTFVGRQVRITFDEEHYYIDLVFYNRLLKSFVLIDLKRGKLKHQDIGQMQMYVNYYDREVKLDDENPTIGLLLCADKTDAMVEYTLPKDNNQIFASKYATVLPSKETLKQLLLNK